MDTCDYSMLSPPKYGSSVGEHITPLHSMGMATHIIFTIIILIIIIDI